MKKSIVILILVIIAIGFGLSYNYLKDDAIINLDIEFLSTDSVNNLEIFYNNGQQYSPHQSISQNFSGSSDFQILNFQFDKDDIVQKLRIDFGKDKTQIIIRKITFSDDKNVVTFLPDSIMLMFEPNNYIDTVYVGERGLHIKTFDYDPFISCEKISPVFSSLRDDYVMKIRIYRILLLLYIILVILTVKTQFFKKTSFKELKKQHHLIVLIILFIAFLLTPNFVKFVGIGEALKNRENRFPARFPDYKSMSTFSFFKEYEKYYKDNFGLRNQMVTTISYLKFKYLNVSAMAPELITVGKENWLFPSEYIYVMLFNLYTDVQLQRIRTTVEERAIWLGEKGIKYYLIIPPTKGRIYSEYLPELYKNRPHTSKIDQVYECTKGIENLVVVDFRENMIRNKATIEVNLYHRYDTHWNNMGAYIAYHQLMETIKLDFPEVEPNQLIEFNISKAYKYEADLLRNLAIGDLVPREEICFDLIAGSKVEEDKPRPYIPTAEFNKSTVSNNLKLMLFGDSFSMAIRPFLAESFQRSAFLWTNEFLLEAIEEELPDIVVQERMEIYLNEFLNPNSERLVKEVEEIRKRRGAKVGLEN